MRSRGQTFKPNYFYQYTITEVDLIVYKAFQQCSHDHVHGYVAIETARMSNIFGDEREDWQVGHFPISIASGGDCIKLKQWQDAMAHDIAENLKMKSHWK
jgi:hypothetical protein